MGTYTRRNSVDTSQTVWNERKKLRKNTFATYIFQIFNDHSFAIHHQGLFNQVPTLRLFVLRLLLINILFYLDCLKKEVAIYHPIYLFLETLNILCKHASKGSLKNRRTYLSQKIMCWKKLWLNKINICQSSFSFAFVLMIIKRVVGIVTCFRFKSINAKTTR